MVLDLSLVLRWGTNCMLIHLKMLVDELVLMVRISGRVVIQMCMGYLGKKCVLMLRVFGWL